MLTDQKTKNIKSILIISHSYKPLLNPRAFRWSAIAEELIGRNIKVDVVTAWQKGQSRKENIRGVKVYRTGGGIIENLRERLRPPHKRTGTAISNKEKRQSPSRLKVLVSRVLHGIHDRTWKQLYWPDYACLWINPAIKQANALLEENRYDAIYTISDPFSSHLAGYEINKRWPGLFWLVDIGDPFSFRSGTPTNNHWLYSYLNLKTEKKIFDAATVITVTTEPTRDKYLSLFEEAKQKMHVIPPLIANATEQNMASLKETTQGSVKMVYVGTLYKSIRNPRYLLRLFERLTQNQSGTQVELHFYGSLNDCSDEFAPYRQYLNKSLFIHGLVNREQVFLATNKASVLVNIGNDNIYQLPSKVVEYAASGKPIINIARTEKDTSARFLKTYPNFLNILQEPSGPNPYQLKQVFNFISQKHARVDDTFLNKFLMPNHIDSITSRYQELSLGEGESKYAAASFVGHNSCV